MAVVRVEEMLDAYEPESHVEVKWSNGIDGRLTLWVNIDGVCRLRVQGIKRKDLIFDGIMEK